MKSVFVGVSGKTPKIKQKEEKAKSWEKAVPGNRVNQRDKLLAFCTPGDCGPIKKYVCMLCVWIVCVRTVTSNPVQKN